MILSKLKTRFIIIYLFTTLSISANNDTVKIFKNNNLLGEVDTIENNNFFSINDFLSSTDSKEYINEKTEKIVFYIEDKKIISTF